VESRPDFNPVLAIQPAMRRTTPRQKSALRRHLHVKDPPPKQHVYDDVVVESADLSDLRPAEYRADLVLLVEHGPRKRLGVILEVQLARDRDKPYVWPVYIANLRAGIAVLYA
jgi:hypothetical protein